MMMLMARSVLFLMVAWACAGAVRAEEIPTTESKCLNDHAKVVGKGDAKSIKAICKRAEKDRIQMMVVTVRSLEDYKPRPMSLDSFVDDLFDEWDIEYDAAKDAILLFVAHKEKQIRIRLGDSYGDGAWKKAQNVMKRTVGPTLRRRPSSGIQSGFSRLFKEVAQPRIQKLKREEQERKRKQGIVNFE